ncbi:sulfurtransferase complex subunit TusC [Salinicola aestuarinus]|uniref:sulfurtransferase complex subunit TusC n=1 Tax=Salinicola aestuarinus TaxID=1949082 RepID=UPI000DA20CB3|nr:sulfurtransferase complex subunit TusC [Salinicola aestuarinus]
MTDSHHLATCNDALLIVLRHPPHGSSWLREGIDVALVTAAFGREVELLFQGDGVFALLENQTTGALGQKGTHPQLMMLEMYDIERLWVSRTALTERGLTTDDLMLPVSVLDSDEIAALHAAHASSLIF